MKTAILKAKPGAQFHFGTIALDVNMALDNTSVIFHSDTLFSAIINEYNKVWGEDIELDTTKFVKLFENESIQISSGSYCIEKNDQYIYFFPKPFTATLLVEKDFKEIKKVKFVSKGILDLGIMPDQWLSTTDSTVLLQDKFVCTLAELNSLGIKQNFDKIKFFKIHNEAKVKVHSLSQDDSLYNQTNVLIEDNSLVTEGLNVHFWFAYELKDALELYAKRFIVILKTLALTGLGGQRSTGSGFFEEVQLNSLSLNESPYSFSISLVHPVDSDDLAQFKFYDLIQRGGRTIRQYTENDYQINIKLSKIRMIMEGAVCDNGKGQIVDLKPIKYITSDSGTSISVLTKDEKQLFTTPFKRYGKLFKIPLHENFIPTSKLNE